MRNHVSEERKKEIILEIKREKSVAIDAEINRDSRVMPGLSQR